MGLSKQLAKIHNSSLNTIQNLGFIFDEHLTFLRPDLICLQAIFVNFAVSLDSKPASTIVHSKHDYCNSLYCNFLYHNLPKSQITRLQQILNLLACAVVTASLFTSLQSYSWLKITECIEYKLLSLTYKVLTTFLSA